MSDFSTLEARIALGRKYSTKYLLDTALVCAVAEHESEGWNPWAIRYEPAFYERYIQPLVNNGSIRTLTKAQARSTSWGLMQIMGQTARELGFSGKFLSELLDPDTGMDYGCKKLQKCLDSFAGNTVNALLKYNGGSDPAYPHLVQDLMPKYYAITQ